MDSKVLTTSCHSFEGLDKLKSEFATTLKKNLVLKNQINKLTTELQQAKQWQNNVWESLEGLQTNPRVTPNESANPRLAKLLQEVTPSRELIVVALENSTEYVKPALLLWLTNVRRLGIGNFLVLALDDKIAGFCEYINVPMYKIHHDNGKNFKTTVTTGSKSNHEVSGLKFHALREILQLGYSVLMSDVDTVYIQNPFEYLYRDSDIECMSGGHDNKTAYGYVDVFDDPDMASARAAHTMRIWAYNSRFFYIRPTVPAIELLDRVASRLAQEDGVSDQVAFNEELFIPSRPGYRGIHALRRTMDFHLFMNSKVLFKTVRKDSELRKTRPVVVHMNCRTGKYERMKAVVEYYVHGKENGIDSFLDVDT